MVVPFQHTAILSGLDPSDRADMMEMVNRAILVLKEIYCPQGFNVGMNIGESAGQELQIIFIFTLFPVGMEIRTLCPQWEECGCSLKNSRKAMSE